MKLEIAVPDCRATQVVIVRATRAGAAETGAVFVSPLADVIKISTGERGTTAL